MLGVNHSNRSNHDYLLWKIESHDLAKLRLNAIPGIGTCPVLLDLCTDLVAGAAT